MDTTVQSCSNFTSWIQLHVHVRTCTCTTFSTISIHTHMSNRSTSTRLLWTGKTPSTVQFRLKYYIGPTPNCMYLREVFVLFSTTYAWTSTWIIVQCNCTPEWPHALFPYANHPCTWWKYDQIRPTKLPACLLTSISCPLKRRRPRLRKTAARVARLRITKPCIV